MVRVNAFRPTILQASIYAGRMREHGAISQGSWLLVTSADQEEEHEQMKVTGPEQGGEHGKQG